MAALPPPTSRPTSNIAWGSAASRNPPSAPDQANGWAGAAANEHASDEFNWRLYELSQHITWTEDLIDLLENTLP